MTTDQVDWEGLKAQLKRAEDGRMITVGPYTVAAILASHERDQRVIEAADKLRDAAMNVPEFYSHALNKSLAEYDKAKQS